MKCTCSGFRPWAVSRPARPTEDGNRSGHPTGASSFYRTPSGMMRVPVETEPTFTAGNPDMLFQTQCLFRLQRRTYDLLPDAQRFLMVRMGQVYRASDAELGCDVALKILPDARCVFQH